MAGTNEQTLRDALIAEGAQSEAQVALLNEKTGNLTPEDFITMVNDPGNWVGLVDADKTILRQIAVMRLKNGQPLFPWNDNEFLSELSVDLEPQLIY
jgi:hypothetical protein